MSMTTDVNTIWDEFHKELKGFIFNKTRNKADTEDLLQEVFIKIIRNIHQVNQAENLRQYLYGIVRNTIRDYFRSRHTATDSIENLEILTEEETESLNATIAECCIRPFIQKLPEVYREALQVSEFQDVSQKELAQRLNISYSGVKSRVQRGKEKLKGLILDCCAYQSDKYGNLRSAEEKNCGCS